MSNRLTKLLLVILSAGFSAWCLAWLFAGAWFCEPNAEDFSLAAKARDEGIIASTVSLLLTYDGRYFTNILHGLNPLAIGFTKGYKLMPVAGILMFALSLFFMLNALLPAREYRPQLIFYSLIFTSVHFALTPSLPHDLYWMVSSFVFLYPWIFVFFWLGSFIHLQRASGNSAQKGWYLLTALLLICGTGMSEMFLIVNAVALFLLSGYYFLQDKNRLHDVLPLAIIGIGCILLFILSPGIHHRASEFNEGRNILFTIQTIGYGTKDFFASLLNWTFRNPLMLPAALLAALYFPAKKPVAADKKMLFVLTVLLLLTAWLMTIPFYLFMGDHTGAYPNRIYTSVLTAYQLALTTAVILVVHYTNLSGFFRRFSYLRNYTAMVLLLGMFAGVLLSDNNISRLKNEYDTGILHQFKDEMELRYTLINQLNTDAPCNAVTLDALSNPPRTIWFPPDIEPDRSHPYWNRAYELYFGIDEVRLYNDTTTISKILMNDAL